MTAVTNLTAYFTSGSSSCGLRFSTPPFASACLTSASKSRINFELMLLTSISRVSAKHHVDAPLLAWIATFDLQNLLAHVGSDRVVGRLFLQHQQQILGFRQLTFLKLESDASSQQGRIAIRSMIAF